jgi:hypothetical protein
VITVRKAEERGVTKLDWLDSRHTFSFGEYYDPKENGFAVLRVINDDRVAPGSGFGTHSHRDISDMVTQTHELVPVLCAPAPGDRQFYPSALESSNPPGALDFHPRSPDPV